MTGSTAHQTRGDGPESLGGIIAELWARRLLLMIVGLSAGIVAAVVALMIQPTYRATVTLAPPVKGAETGGLAALAGQFSGLADLAGVSLGGGGDVDQSIALMVSRQFTEQFMKDEHVLQAMYPEMWDAAANRWKVSQDGGSKSLGQTLSSWFSSGGSTAKAPVDSRDEGGPSLWLAYKKFDRLRQLTKDKKTSLIILTVDWKDPVVAARWANQLVARLNLHARKRATEEAQRNLDYLNAELPKTRELEMQQTIYKLIEREMRTKMAANVREEYAFRVLDPAIPPEERESPKRTMIVIAAMFIAGFLTSLWIVFGPRKRAR